MNFYDRHLGDYATACGHLTMIEDGAYQRLLDRYYAQEGPYPDDLQVFLRLARAGSSAERKAVERVMVEFFPVGPDGLRHNKRADEEIARFHCKSGKRRDAANVRWGAERAQQVQCTPDANAMQKHPVCMSDAMLRAPVPSAVSRQPLAVNQDVTTTPSATLLLVPEPVAETAPLPDSVAKGSARNGHKKKPPDEPSASQLTWQAYSEAYEDVYHTLPVRNAKVNGQVAAFVGRVGADEAPRIAAWFLGHRAQWYVQHCHSWDCLLKDAEALRTQWACGVTIHAKDAREVDRQSSDAGMWDRAAAKAAEIGDGRR